MSPHFHWPHWHRHLRAGRRHASRALPLVLGTIVLSLFASTLQVVEIASGPVSGASRGDLQAQATDALSVEDANDNVEAGAIATRFIEVPSASADAISL